MDGDSDSDDKTDALRSIFLERASDDTVTETQTADRGSLTGDEEQIAEQIRGVVAEMRDRYEFETDLDDGDLVSVVRGFYAGRSDGAIADELGVEADTVARARLDLHLIRDADTDAPFDIERLGELIEIGASIDEAAQDLDVSPGTVRHYRAVLAARHETRAAGRRYRSQFVDAIPAAGLDETLTGGIMEDGLEDATEGMETDVSF